MNAPDPAQTRLSRLSIKAEGDQYEPLVLALRAVLNAYGTSVDYDELAAVTGAAFMVTCAPRDPDPKHWPLHGRDAFLQQTAHAYGLVLRELHPPAAAPVPAAPSQFAAHFRDSYLPFIEDALVRDEPVLAWMGWPAPHEAHWGVITEVDPHTKTCFGCSCGTAGRRVALPGPPVQIYLVQGRTEARPSPAEILTTALHRAAIVLKNEMDPTFGVISGPPALERWRDAILSMDMPAVTAAPGPASADLPLTSDCGTAAASATHAAGFHHYLARFLVTGRRAAVRFLRHYREHADEGQIGPIDTCIAAFREVAVVMEPTADGARLRAVLETGQGRDVLVEALTRAIQLERLSAKALVAFTTR